MWDFFISHATEDKDAVARPLAALLSKRHFSVWLDEGELRLGDSLRSKIDHGLANSHHGIVILSKSFFAKYWPQQELGGLVSKESIDRKVIIPVWHQVDRAFVAAHSPTLADKLAVSTKEGLQIVADHICRSVRTNGAVPSAGVQTDEMQQPSIGHPSVVVHRQEIATIKVKIAQMSDGTISDCEVPLDARNDRLVFKLAQVLGLPLTHPLDGRPLAYFLHSKAQGRRLDEKSTLRDSNIHENDTLVIGLEMIAG
jgi:hypothetical protein